MHERQEFDLTVPLVDIAEALVPRHYPGDNRQRYKLYEEWAQDFLVDFAARAAAGRRPEETYRQDITDFALRKAAAYGFAA
jgi:hypothetical protein